MGEPYTQAVIRRENRRGPLLLNSAYLHIHKHGVNEIKLKLEIFAQFLSHAGDDRVKYVLEHTHRRRVFLVVFGALVYSRFD